jgi:hypothetical protein
MGDWEHEYRERARVLLRKALAGKEATVVTVGRDADVHLMPDGSAFVGATVWVPAAGKKPEAE